MPSGRGSIVGLRRHYRDKERATRDALLCAYGQLMRDKPGRVWTKAEFWRLAGLRSGNALRNPRHFEVLAQFEAHNRDIKSAMVRSAADAQREEVGENATRVLHQKLAEMKGQLDKACSLNAVYQREALYYRQQYEDVATRLERALRERDEWKRKALAEGLRQSVSNTAIVTKEEFSSPPSGDSGAACA